MHRTSSQLRCAALAAQCVCIALFCSVAQAAVPVEESVGEAVNADATPQETAQSAAQTGSRRLPPLNIPPTIEPGTPADVNPRPLAGSVSSAPPSGGGQGLGDLFYQVQMLQQEVQTLRGLVEEQTFLIQRLQRDQKEQYLDLDSRVLALVEQRPEPGPITSVPLDTGTPLAAVPATEREAYRVAFDAMKARNFDASIDGFRNLIETYPNGQYTPNAFYWMGEIYLVGSEDAEQARQSFMQVINLYPDHQKTPDALYKLGVVYHRLGDIEAAKRYLARVQNEHGQSAAADLARKYAAELP